MILDRYAERRAEEIAGGSLTSNNPFGLVSLIGGSGSSLTSSGVAVNEWTAEGIPALYACQRAISNTVGQIPIKLMNLDGDKKTPDLSNPLYYVLHDMANPEMTAFEFVEMMTRFLVAWGNAYAQIIRDGQGRVTALWILQPWRMRVSRDDEMRRVYEYNAPNSKTYTWVWNTVRPQIMHLRINSIDGLVGRSPVRVLMDSFGLTLAANQFGASFFANYGRPSMAIKHKGRLKPEAKRNLRESWAEIYSGNANRHKVAVLDEDMAIEQFSIPPDEAQFVETRSMQIEETARSLSVPLFAIQHMTKSTSWGSGIEQMMLFWLATGLKPYLIQWKQSIARDMISVKSFDTKQAVFITNALLSTDFKTRMDGYDVQIGNGMLSPNEARALEDMNPRTDQFGDQYNVKINNSTPSSLAGETKGDPNGNDPEADAA